MLGTPQRVPVGKKQSQGPVPEVPVLLYQVHWPRAGSAGSFLPGPVRVEGGRREDTEKPNVVILVHFLLL